MLRRLAPDAALLSVPGAVLALALLLPGPSAGQAAPASPTLDERWLLDELNTRRRAGGAGKLEWDPTAYAALRATDLAALEAGADAPDQAAKLVKARRGYGVDWACVVRRSPEWRRAVDGVLAYGGLLGAEYNIGTAVIADVAGAEPSTVAVLYAGKLPPLLGRARLNGPAGAYRVRCPACKREFVYALPAPRGFVSIDCPSCGTLMTPHIEDGRGALHWPTFYVRPYAPLAIANPFLAWKWVNEHVLYNHPKADRDLYGWQTPQETALLKTGVCRDTSVMLAAWLRSMGLEARVATGYHGAGKHAWVVMGSGEARYLLETAMDGNLGTRMPPRLELATDYLASEMIFDDARVLLNRGQRKTRDYDSALWFAAQELP